MEYKTIGSGSARTKIGNRSEWVNKAKESCLKNYCGDVIEERIAALGNSPMKKIKPLENIPNIDRMKTQEVQAEIVENTVNKEQQEVTQDTIDLSNIHINPEDFMVESNITYIEEPNPFNDKSEDYISGLKENQEHSNFVTSIQNANLDMDQVQLKEKEERYSFQVLVVRCVLALSILTAVIIIDKIDFKYKGFDANWINHFVTSNDSMNKLEDFIVSLTSIQKE